MKAIVIASALLDGLSAPMYAQRALVPTDGAGVGPTDNDRSEVGVPAPAFALERDGGGASDDATAYVVADRAERGQS